MKTQTYARISLLIPLLLWVIFLLGEILITVVNPAELRSNEPFTVLDFIELVLSFYVIGILFWFLPYLLLSSVLLAVSFNSRLDGLKYLFVLSPFAMAILVMLETTIVSLFSMGGYALLSADFALPYGTIIGFNLMMGILSLVYGYICVGLGFASYKLLQRFGKIKDEEKTKVEIIHLNNQPA